MPKQTLIPAPETQNTEVLEVSKSTVEKWAKEIRNLLKISNESAAKAAFRVGQMFHSMGWQNHLGYATWNEFLAAHNINERRGRIYLRMFSLCQHYRVTEEQMAGVGYYSMIEILAMNSKSVNILGSDNINSWIDFAKHSTVNTLNEAKTAAKNIKAVTTSKDDDRKLVIMPPELSSDNILDSMVNRFAEDNKSFKKKPKQILKAIQNIDTKKEKKSTEEPVTIVNSGDVDVPVASELTTVKDIAVTATESREPREKMTFNVSSFQKSTIQSAVDTVLGLEGIQDPSIALEMICIEFLSTASEVKFANTKRCEWLVDRLNSLHGNAGKFSFEPKAE